MAVSHLRIGQPHKMASPLGLPSKSGPACPTGALNKLLKALESKQKTLQSSCLMALAAIAHLPDVTLSAEVHLQSTLLTMSTLLITGM